MKKTNIFSTPICSAAMLIAGSCFSTQGHCSTTPAPPVISRPSAPSTADSRFYPKLTTDPDYRVIVAPSLDQAEVPFPNPATNWTITYQFVVPPLPAATWNYTNQTFYIWGDIDFDEYGSAGSYPISSYLYNQIVPQLMIGNVLSGNDASYHPSWQAFPTWVIQASYFWENSNGSFYSQTGQLISVSPGETVNTIISYNSTSGAITVNIASNASSISSITIPRPFPNETNPPFSSWKDFFTKASAKSPQFIARSEANVESHYVDQATTCSLLPWVMNNIFIPGIPSVGSNFQVSPYNGLSCPGPLATLKF